MTGGWSDGAPAKILLLLQLLFLFLSFQSNSLTYIYIRYARQSVSALVMERVNIFPIFFFSLARFLLAFAETCGANDDVA